jgi:integrase
MRKALTAKTIDNLLPRDKRYEVGDAACPGLRVVVFPSEAKSFVLRYRHRGVPRKLTIGPLFIDNGELNVTPQIGGPQTLASARMLAAKALHESKAGTDPVVQQRKQRDAQRMVDPNTFQAVAEQFLEMHDKKLRTIGQRRADFKLLFPELGKLPIADIRRTQYVKALDVVAAEHGESRADRVLLAVHRLLRVHMLRTDDFRSPLVPGMRRRAPRIRSRILTDAELVRVWLAAEADPGPFGAFIRFLLLTAARRSEAALMRRVELQNDGTEWLIPASRYKSKRDMLIPLSSAAQAIITARPKLPGGDFVFSTTGRRGLSGFGRWKDKFDAACGVTGWRLHDLRRSSRTLLSRCGVSPDVSERCLGHALAGIRKHYDVFEFRDEKLAAFEKLAALISEIVPPPTTITKLTAAREKRARGRR